VFDGSPSSYLYKVKLRLHLTSLRTFQFLRKYWAAAERTAQTKILLDTTQNIRRCDQNTTENTDLMPDKERTIFLINFGSKMKSIINVYMYLYI
jgi:hypothetical protein